MLFLWISKRGKKKKKESLLRNTQEAAAMGNCCSDVSAGQSAVGGTASFQANPSNATNDAVDMFLQSRGYNGLFSRIEVAINLSSE